MSTFGEDRRHPASATRRAQARKDGDSAKSNELTVSIQILAAVALLYFGLPQIGYWIHATTTSLWDQQATFTDVESTVGQTQNLIHSLVWVLAPMMLGFFLFGWVAHIVQTGLRLRLPKFSLARSSGSSWFTNFFSWSTVVLPFVTLPKMLLAIGVAGVSTWWRRESFFSLGGLPVDEMVSATYGLGIRICFEVAIVLLLASLIDYAVQWFGFENRIRMSDQELRDELRSQNGDPVVSQQRQRMVRQVGQRS